jgi:hypothetical protein
MLDDRAAERDTKTTYVCPFCRARVGIAGRRRDSEADRGPAQPNFARHKAGGRWCPGSGTAAV